MVVVVVDIAERESYVPLWTDVHKLRELAKEVSSVCKRFVHHSVAVVSDGVARGRNGWHHPSRQHSDAAIGSSFTIDAASVLTFSEHKQQTTNDNKEQQC